MKYGVIIPDSNYGNIGDDIWAYAAMQFLPHCDYFIDRLKISQFKSINNEDVCVLIASFLMPDNNEHWFLPTNNIIPKIISLHCRHTSGDWISKEKVVEYMKCNEPVGAKYGKPH